MTHSLGWLYILMCFLCACSISLAITSDGNLPMAANAPPMTVLERGMIESMRIYGVLIPAPLRDDLTPQYMTVIVSDARGGMTNHTIRIHERNNLLLQGTLDKLKRIHNSFTRMHAYDGTVYMFRAHDLVAIQDVPGDAPEDPSVVQLHRQVVRRQASFKQAVFRHRFSLFSFDLEYPEQSPDAEWATLMKMWEDIQTLRLKYPRKLPPGIILDHFTTELEDVRPSAPHSGEPRPSTSSQPRKSISSYLHRRS